MIQWSGLAADTRLQVNWNCVCIDDYVFVNLLRILPGHFEFVRSYNEALVHVFVFTSTGICVVLTFLHVALDYIV